MAADAAAARASEDFAFVPGAAAAFATEVPSPLALVDRLPSRALLPPALAAVGGTAAVGIVLQSTWYASPCRVLAS